MSWLSLPTGQFVYNGYVYDCNNLPSFMSTVPQGKQPDWFEFTTGQSCGIVWIYSPGINTTESLGSSESMNSTDTSSVNAFWNEYATLVPQ